MHYSGMSVEARRVSNGVLSCDFYWW